VAARCDGKSFLTPGDFTVYVIGVDNITLFSFPGSCVKLKWSQLHCSRTDFLNSQVFDYSVTVADCSLPLNTWPQSNICLSLFASRNMAARYNKMAF